jgi:hypothetical protein
MKPDFSEIVTHFRFEGDLIEACPHPSGHINDTYAAWFGQAGGATCRYVLQRINHEVFRHPEGVMHNIERVTGHLRDKIVAAGGDPERETLTLVPTHNASFLHRSHDGSYWRAFVYIEGARTYEVVESLDHVYHAGQAFGQFQRLLGDFPARQLYETIPGFHHTPKRFEAFVEAVERDVENRARTVGAEIDFVLARSDETSILLNLLEQGTLPERVTHNDTKFNNVMIDDETGKGICVIDLDTVMPGLSLYDFGDAVRSGANSAAEDEADLAKVSIDLEIFDRLTHGYLDATRDVLTASEIDYLPFSARLLTLECGIRFLTDHLNGDVYFRVHRKNHNLDRCRTQFKMVRDMESCFGEMTRIVDKYR